MSSQSFEEYYESSPKIVLSFHSAQQAQKIATLLETLRLNHEMSYLLEVLFENERRTLVLVFDGETTHTADLLKIMDKITSIASEEGIQLSHFVNSRLLIAK